MLNLKEIPMLKPCPHCGAEQSISDMTGVFFIQEHIFINGCDAIKTSICCGKCHRRSDTSQFTTSATLDNAAQLGIQFMAETWNDRGDK